MADVRNTKIKNIVIKISISKINPILNKTKIAAETKTIQKSV